MMDRSLLVRELRFQLRSPAFLLWMGLVFALSSLAVGAGMLEVAQQRATLETLLAGDAEDRADALGKQSDWGGAAYYSFHLTWNPPSNFAFAALGVRDREPWKHRVRMLALEGQIYEHDAGNPVLALTGRFDFAFFAAFVLPLVLAVLLHDLKASERTAGRYALLVTMSGRESMPWRARALLRTAGVFLASGAWDLPTEVTMDAFVARHPEWAAYAEIEGAFEWKWYYAFQQVGDQAAEPLARAYRDARLRRDRLSSYLALLSPPALLERGFQRLARTDLSAALAYEARVRAFHARLRAFYYDKLFPAEPFDRSALAELPQFEAGPGGD